jgi:decaprenyl-phosphate phosphoribosyltransferase
MTIAFCLISSTIYIINDINDVERDRAHPQKCQRPIASGEISIRSAKIAVFILLLITVTMVFVTYAFNLKAIILLLIYFLMNFGYSNGLKNIPILDVAILAAGYLVRLFYGACIVSVVVSPWLYLTVMAGAFYLGMCKRRNEIRKISNGGNTRKVLERYNYDFLDKNMYVCLGLAITFYSLWAIQTDFTSMIWTVPFVILIFMKYSLDVENDNSEGDPMKTVLEDKVLLFLVSAYILAVFLIIYIL